MTALVDQLRACDCGIHCKSGCIQEKAADEIELLQEALVILKIAVDREGWPSGWGQIRRQVHEALRVADQ